MSTLPMDSETLCPVLETRLLGAIEFQRCLDLQRRLVEEAYLRGDGRITLLLAEHPAVVTIGRGGCSRRLTALSGVLRRGQLPVHWVNRGGGCMVHAPGQLAVYLVAPLRWYGLTVAAYLERLQGVLEGVMDELSVRAERPIGGYGLEARTGRFATLGVAVRNWVSYYGAYINVQPAMGLFRLLEENPDDPVRMTSLMAELGRAARMTAVRTAVIRQVAAAFGCQREIVQA